MHCNCVQSLSEHCAWAAFTSHALRLRNVLTATTSLHLLKLGTPISSTPKQDREPLMYSFPEIIWLSTVMTELTKALLWNMETFQTSCSNFNACIIAAVSTLFILIEFFIYWFIQNQNYKNGFKDKNTFNVSVSAALFSVLEGRGCDSGTLWEAQ